MSPTPIENAHAVLLPALDTVLGPGPVEPPGWLAEALRAGTRSVLLGETRTEYVDRRMSAQREAAETAEAVRGFTAACTRAAGGPLLVAADEEPWGIQRFHRLAAPLGPPAAPEEAQDFEAAAHRRAADVRALGATVLLAPVLDRLTGDNAWLAGRTLMADSTSIAALGAAFVRGAQAAGTACVCKHVPGFPAATADPAEAPARVPAAAWEPEALEPFRAAVGAGALGMMTGPAPVEAVDADEPACTSAAVTALLRERLGFAGLIVSDDLDAPATTLGRSVPQTAVAALAAGADLLLLAGGPQVEETARALAHAAAEDPALAHRLAEAAGRVRALADRLEREPAA